MKDRQVITLRVEKEMAEFLRKQAYEHKLSINEVVNKRLKKYKDLCESMLTKDDSMIS